MAALSQCLFQILSSCRMGHELPCPNFIYKPLHPTLLTARILTSPSLWLTMLLKVKFMRRFLELFLRLFPLEAPFALLYPHDGISLPHYPSLKLPLPQYSPSWQPPTASDFVTLCITFSSYISTSVHWSRLIPFQLVSTWKIPGGRPGFIYLFCL